MLFYMYSELLTTSYQITSFSYCSRMNTLNSNFHSDKFRVSTLLFYINNGSVTFDSIQITVRDTSNFFYWSTFMLIWLPFIYNLVLTHVKRSFYTSFRWTRDIVWSSGVMILLIFMLTAFTGYSLIWGQMSYWGIMVITNF